MAYCYLSNLVMFEECKDFGPTLYQRSRFNTCRNLGVFLKNQVFDTKKHIHCVACKNLGFFKEYKDIGPTSYPIPRFNTSQNLGWFHKNQGLTPKFHGLSFQNLGTFNEYEDVGLTSYQNLRFSACQNLGLFHKNHVFGRQNFMAYFACQNLGTCFFFSLTPKIPWPIFACQNYGPVKEYKHIGLTSFRNLRFTTCQNLRVFHKNHVFDAK